MKGQEQITVIKYNMETEVFMVLDLTAPVLYKNKPYMLEF